MSVSQKTKRDDLKTDDANFLIFDRITKRMKYHKFGFVDWKTINQNIETGTTERQATIPETGDRINTLFQVRGKKYFDEISDKEGKITLVERPRERRNVAVNRFFFERLLKSDPNTIVFFCDFNKERPEDGMKYYGANFINNLLVSRRDSTYVLIPEDNFPLFEEWKILFEERFGKSASMFNMTLEILKEEQAHQLIINDAVEHLKELWNKHNLETQTFLKTFSEKDQSLIAGALIGENK